MLLKLSHSTHRARFQKALYCATVILFSGCTGLKSYNAELEQSDSMSAQHVQERARTIPSLVEARKIEAEATARQTSLDTQLKITLTNCIKKYFVNHCINIAREQHKLDWDAAQNDLTAARYYDRLAVAEDHRVTLEAKVNAYNKEEIAKAPERAARKIAFEAKSKAFDAKIAAAPKLTPEVRAANVTTYEEKRNKILALQKQRTEDAKKRAELATKEAEDKAAKAIEAAKAAAAAER